MENSNTQWIQRTLLMGYLQGLHGEDITEKVLSFENVETIIHGTLPRSARKHRAWLSNSRRPEHALKDAWLDAGWKTRNVNMEEETVEFFHVLTAEVRAFGIVVEELPESLI